MRKALKQLRKQRTLLDRAIRALEALETLQSRRAQDPRDLNPSSSAGETMPGEVIIFPGGASRAKVSRSRSAANEPARRTGSGRDANNG